MSKFPDFDTLRQLAKENPESLQALLDKETASIMAQCPPRLRPRLEGLQFRIEGQRRLAKNPMDSLLRIYGMMNQSFEELNDALAPFRQLNEQSIMTIQNLPETKKAKTAGKVLNFQPSAAANRSSQYRGA